MSIENDLHTEFKPVVSSREQWVKCSAYVDGICTNGHITNPGCMGAVTIPNCLREDRQWESGRVTCLPWKGDIRE